MKTRIVRKLIRISQLQQAKLQDLVKELGVSESEIIGKAIDDEFDIEFGMNLLGRKSIINESLKSARKTDE